MGSSSDESIQAQQSASEGSESVEEVPQSESIQAVPVTTSQGGRCKRRTRCILNVCFALRILLGAILIKVWYDMDYEKYKEIYKPNKPKEADYRFAKKFNIYFHGAQIVVILVIMALICCEKQMLVVSILTGAMAVGAYFLVSAISEVGIEKFWAHYLAFIDAIILVLTIPFLLIYWCILCRSS